MIFWLAAIVGVLLILASQTSTGTLSETLDFISGSSEGSIVGNLTVSMLADAIQVFEGWMPGSRSYRNNNPGNLEYHSQAGTIGADLTNRQPPGYAIFASYADGRRALEALIRQRISQHPTWTLLDFFYSYAPPTDDNNPEQYASTVAQIVGASADTQLGAFV